MLTAVEYLGPVGVGVTSPQLFRADDHKVYVVKLQKNKMGAKVLVNEFIAARIGGWLELCFPPGGLIYISDGLLHNKRLRARGISSGPHFACQYLKSAQYIDRYTLCKAINKAQMAGVMLFDHLFHNLDRTWNRKNLLIRRETAGYKIYAIDNSHLFRRGVWNEAALCKLAREIRLNRRRAYGILLKYFLVPQDFEVYAEKIRQIPDEAFIKLVREIPQEWLTKEEERQALLAYLMARRNMVGQISARVCSLIPDVHRRTNVDKNK